MKWLFYAILLFSVTCTPPPKFRDVLPPDELTTEFVEEHNKGKDASFDKIAEWVAVNYKSAKDVIQLSSKESGTLVLKPVWKFAYPVDPLKTSFWDGYVNYTLTVT